MRAFIVDSDDNDNDARDPERKWAAVPLRDKARSRLRPFFFIVCCSWRDSERSCSEGKAARVARGIVVFCCFSTAKKGLNSAMEQSDVLLSAVFG